MLKTKLHRPPISLEHVFRYRLIDELNKNIYKPLSLFCAPAGYGKSMLASSWIQESGYPTAWLSLSEDDNDFRTFINYIIASVQKVFPNKLEKTEALVNVPELPSKQKIIHSLINDLDQVTENYILVLDDYHLIHNNDIHSSIDEMLSFPPENIHLCILTRHDPPLRIKNLRAHKRMNEIRMDELAFSEEEIIGLFKNIYGITLNKSTAVSLFKRTEGWITALHLILLVSKNKPEFQKELSAFSGDLNTLSDFLTEEILSPLSNDMKKLLYSCALLDRFSFELVNACFLYSEDESINRSKTETLFQQLLHSNLFLIPLDDERLWFRFHHLFQKILLKQLEKISTIDKTKAIYHFTGKWFLKEGLIDEAIEYMLKAKKVEEAAKIVKSFAHPEFLKNVGRVEVWLNKLPLEIKENNLDLLLLKAWHAFGQFHLEEIPGILEKANALIKDSELDLIQSTELSFFKANGQYWMGDTEGCIRTLSETLDQRDNLPEHIRCNIDLVLYLALQKKGDYKRIVKKLNERIKNTAKYTDYDIAYFYGSLSFVHLLSGSLRSTLDVGVQMQMFTEKIGADYLLNWSYYLQALAYLQLFHLEDALHYFQIVGQKHFIIDTVVVFDARASLGLIHQLNNNSEEANSIISTAIDYAKEISDPLSLLIMQSAQARVALLQGDVKTAFQWANTFNAAPHFSGMFFWQEIPWMTKAKVFIANGTRESLAKAETLLNELFDIASLSNLDCQLVEINLLLSISLQKLGQKESSKEKLKSAVSQAEKYGFIRPFVEAGNSALELLNLLKDDGPTTDFIREIERLTDKAAEHKRDLANLHNASNEEVVLTDREIEILQLLADGFRNKEIAHKLFVSEGTIKKHAYNMGQKFNTNSRVELLSQASALGFIH